MSKKKFDPEKLSVFQINEAFIDPIKLAELLKLQQKFSDPEYVKAFYNKSHYSFVHFVKSKLCEIHGLNIEALVEKYSLIFPDFRIREILATLDDFFLNQFPGKEFTNYANSKIKSIQSKDFAHPEDKKYQKVLNIDWIAISSHISDYFFIKRIFEFYSGDRNLTYWLKEIIDSIDYYFGVKNRKLTFKVGASEKEVRQSIWPHLENELVVPLFDFFEAQKEMLFNDGFSEEEFEKILINYREYCVKAKEIDFARLSWQELVGYVKVIGDSKIAIFQILHDILIIFFPADFTSPEEWTKRYGYSPYTPKGFVSKELYDIRTHEVKKFLALY